MSRFLKLSTSRDALLLPGATFSVAFRSSAAPLSRGSMDANVRAKGFAGTPAGDVTGWRTWYSLREPDHMSAVVVSLPCPVIGVLGFPSSMPELDALVEPAKLAGCTGCDRSTCSLRVDCGARGSLGESSPSSVSGCGGINVVLSPMRTCFFVLCGGA
jgi:hypothetical protein